MSELIEYPNGDKHWLKNNQLHREDGPAIEYANGSKLWIKNGRLHRENGPAFENARGEKFWYLNDEKLTEQEFNKILAKKRIKLIK